MTTVILNTAWGGIECCYSEQGIYRLSLPIYANPPQQTRAGLPRQLERQLAEYLQGNRQYFTLPLDWARLGDAASFRLAVYRALLQIPYGTVITYGGLAAQAGSPRAARAVGTAMKHNPIPMIIPCHRVVAANSDGGYSAGMEWKYKLWEVEKIVKKRRQSN